MTALEAIKQIQGILGVEQDGDFGKVSNSALQGLIVTPSGFPWPNSGVDTGWPFTVRVDGEDIVCENIVITCFGGAYDPQDNGETASGRNTKSDPLIEGVSVAMDGRMFSGLSAAEHDALDGAPLPKLPWGTLVQVTIGNITRTPKDGIIDLGPGKQASKPGQPHALDMTVAAASPFAVHLTNRELAQNFEARGSFRVLGGAKYLPKA